MSERVVRLIRWGLVVAWMVLIVSLFLDPYTSELTLPTSESPFRLNRFAEMEDASLSWACPTQIESPDGTIPIDWIGYPEGECDPRCTRLQGKCVIERPYAMGARVFWTMGLPLLPFLFMLFGHEFWRRICPLSALSQIPRRLRRQRTLPILDEGSGKVERRLALISPNSFLGKNFWFVQFGLLCTGVSARLLFINSNRLALAFFFILVIVAAMVVGYLYGGKTWCQYICPLSPVQKIYSEPRGLLESAPHETESKVTQSMCRTIKVDKSEVSACVGCISPCPDIDLERQYWQKLDQPGRRFTYYGYVGMILGFYGYYMLHAGNWDYYFSGAWTHEEGQLASVMSPGFFFGGSPVPGLPKLFAAPLTIAASVFVAYGVGRLLEGLWATLAARIGRPLNPETQLHKALAIASVVSLNCFYFFGGRPNINLMSEPLQSGIGFAIAGVSVLWLARAWPRSSAKFGRDSVARRLRTQLARLQFDFGAVLQGRKIEDLSTDEVYALAKALPAMNFEQRIDAYRKAVRDNYVGGRLSNAAGAEVLLVLRDQLDIDDQMHERVLAELGISDVTLLDPNRVISEENRIRLEGYRERLEELIDRVSRAEGDLAVALVRPGVVEEIGRAMLAYRITKEEHESVLGEFVGGSGRLVRRAKEDLQEIRRIAGWADVLAEYGEANNDAICRLLSSGFQARRDGLLRPIAMMLVGLQNDGQAVPIARTAAASAPAAFSALLAGPTHYEGEEREWADLLHISVVKAARAQIKTSLQVFSQSSSYSLDSPEGLELLEETILTDRFGGAAIRSAALAVLESISVDKARTVSKRLLHLDREQWLLSEVAELILAGRGSRSCLALSMLARLHGTALFADAQLPALAKLARSARPWELEADGIVCSEGDPSSDVFCITRGSAGVFIKSGDSQMQVATMGVGESVGELGLLTRRPRSATVRAGEKGMELIVIDGPAFDRYLNRNGRHLLELVSRRLVGLNRILAASSK